MGSAAPPGDPDLAVFTSGQAEGDALALTWSDFVRLLMQDNSVKEGVHLL